MKNILLAISGPSGVGKGTLVKRIVEHNDDVVTSVSCTTRKPREGEIDKVHYFFITKEEFERTIEEGGFLEYDAHFNNYYGTPKKFVEDTLKEKSVILEIDVQGALNAKKVFPEAVLIMVAPPSMEELKARLINRGTETAEQIENRLERVNYELSFKDKYDYTVVNDTLEEAEERIMQIINKEKNK